MSEQKKKLVAYHEAGHAVVGALMPEYDPVTKISIVPRGAAGGLTFFALRGATRVRPLLPLVPREPDGGGDGRSRRGGAHLRRGERHHRRLATSSRCPTPRA